MKLILLFFLLSGFALTCAAQEICQLSLQDAPTLLNLKLGATTAEARAVFGKDLKIKNKTKGEYTFFQNYIETKSPDSLPNVRAIYLRFYDGRLYQIEIFYAGENSSPSTIEDFVNSLNAKLNLPAAGAWQIKYGIAELNCGAFSLAASALLNSRVELTDENVRAKVEAARKEK